MPTRSLAAALVALTSLTLWAQQPRPAARPSPSRVEKTVPFHVGETLTYDVSWSSFLTAGTASATVKEQKSSSGSSVYYIVAEGRPTPIVAALYSLYYKVDTLLDASTLLPQRGSVFSEEGKRHKYKLTQFDRAAQQVSFELQSATTVKSTFKAPSNTQDVLSALYVLRTLPLGSGARTTMPVSDDGKIYQLHVQVAGTERVQTPLGELTAWRINPTIEDDHARPVGRNIALWISDDARRLPLKIQADLPVGNFSLTLRSAN